MRRIFLKSISLVLGILIHLGYLLRLWVLKNPMQAYITGFVLCMHLIGLFFIAHQRDIFFPQKKPESLVINTIKQLPLPKPQTTPLLTVKAAAPSQNKKNPISQTQQKKKKLLKDLEKSLAKIEKTSPVKKNLPPAPKPIEMKEEDFIASDEFQIYQSKLIAFLSQSLSFPERGEVKVRLSIGDDGAITAFEILSSNNKKNALYLKNKLPFLKIPCFNKSMKKNPISLLITFSGEHE